jgi:hypothetical protein
MSYETKALLKALAEIVVVKKTPESIYKSLTRIANAEGVILPTFEEMVAEMKDENKE